MTPAPVLSLRGVGKTYEGSINVLRDVDLDIAEGELVAIVGPSGSGKTTLLRLMGTRARPTAGDCALGGCAAGWLDARQLGFGRASIAQRTRHQRRRNADRILQMDARQFMVEEVDPLLEKISREGLQSLNRTERQTLERAREKLEENS